MSAAISQQPENGAAIAPAPLLTQKGKAGTAATNETMETIVTKLASLRERYLAELQAARTSVKKNFLR